MGASQAPAAATQAEAQVGFERSNVGGGARKRRQHEHRDFNSQGVEGELRNGAGFVSEHGA
eukprot:3668129-Prymnesium_polylepis.1